MCIYHLHQCKKRCKRILGFNRLHKKEKSFKHLSNLHTTVVCCRPYSILSSILSNAFRTIKILHNGKKKSTKVLTQHQWQNNFLQIYIYIQKKSITKVHCKLYYNTTYRQPTRTENTTRCYMGASRIQNYQDIFFIKRPTHN